MSETLEPRIVDKPFARRWLVTTLALIGRAPLRFGCLIALLGLLDMPLFGMTNAAFLVFMGVFNYVVYRDIFERRAQNAPLPALSRSAALLQPAEPTAETGH